MTKNNNNSPNNNNNQNYNYGNNNPNSEQNYNEYYQNNNQYYNQNQYFEQDTNLGNYNQQYNNYDQEYNNYNQNYYNQYNEQNYNNYNQNFNQDNTKDNLEQNQYSNDYNSQNNNQYYNGYQQNNQNYKYSEQDYNNYQNNYNQNYQQDYPQNYGYTNHDYIHAQNNYNQNHQQSNLNRADSDYYQESTQNITTGQKTIGTYNVNQTNSNTNGVEENKQTYASAQKNNFQQNQNTYQNNNNQNRESIPPIPPVMNPKNLKNSPYNPKKKSKGKLVAIVSTLLGIVLLTGGGYYYYSKKSKTKNVNENEVYSSIIQKYKAAINNPDSADKSINIEALKAALKEKKNDDYIRYLFYDIDGNGRKELLISRNDKPNNPIDMYTFNKNNKVIRLFNSETIDSTILNKLGVDGSNNNSGSAVFKDKTIRIRKFDKDTGEYNFLRFSKDGDKLEKTNVITFTGLDVDNSKYKDITTGKEYDSKNSFNSTYPLPELLKFDNENWKSVKNFGEITNNNNNNKNNNNDNSQNKKPDNYEKAYASVLKNYKDAISSGKNDAKDVNTVAITNYKVFGEKQVGNSFLNYGFFDINGDGIDELLLFTEASKDKPNEYSPMDVYTLDKNNKVVRITPEFVNGERTTLSITKDKIFQVYGSGGAQVHGYTFYKLNNDGLALEKTDAFDFDGVTNSKVYKRSYPSGKNEEIPVNDFRDKVVNSNNHIKFDFSKRKSIFDFKG